MKFDFDCPYPVEKVPVFARNIVATSQPLAAQAGLQMILRGGNAMDAALATAIALTVLEPTGNGVGSDAFCIVWDGQKLHGLNASGRSPAGWTPERFGDAMPSRGWESVTVPGAVSAWTTLSERFGKLAFADLFGPAIHYARYGFPVSPRISKLWKIGGETLKDQPGFAAHFLKLGHAPASGETFVNEDLAGTLEAIADSKGAAFYSGKLAEKIAAFAAQYGSVLTREDLATHENDWCGTVSARFRGVDLHEIPPNGQGIAAAIALGILEHTDIDRYDVDSVEATHLQIEAIKLALADVDRHVADPHHMLVSPQAMLDPDYLAGRAKIIDMRKAGDPGAGAPKLGGTVYLSACDEKGMMVSYIQSNYAGFGSGVVVPGTGIHLQNRGLGFTTESGHPNQVGPRKRPFHTIIPGFLMKDSQPLMSFGVMGGPMQAQGHVQMVVRTVVFGQNPQTASDAPRWRFVSGRDVAVEHNMQPATVNGLAELGHEIRRDSPDNSFAFGGAQLVCRYGDGYVAGSDHRKDGAALGI